MLLSQGIQDFVKYMKLIDRSKQTITGYEKELSYFNNFLSVKHNCPAYIEDIELKDMEDYLLDQKKRVNTFYSDMSQRVETLNVSVGDRVKKGDIILVYENNYDLEIERANKQIEAITASYNESVKGADFQEISNLKLNISTIETNLNFARSNLEKIKTLYENNAISQVEYDEAKNNVAILENQLQEANNNYSKIIQGVSANVKKEYEAQIDEVMIQIKILEKNMEQVSVKAEFDGVITELNVHQGSMTQAGVPTVEIQDDKNLGIYVEVLAEDAIEVTKGMAFNIIDEDEVIKELQVNRVYPKAQAKISDLGVEQKRVRIEADLDDADYKLGMQLPEWIFGAFVPIGGIFVALEFLNYSINRFKEKGDN
jgi:HlyD family secretion protein